MATCTLHPERESVAECTNCGKGICPSCLYYADSDPYCRDCVAELEKAYAVQRKSLRRRTLLAGLAGSVVAVAAVLGWQWGMFRTGFGMAMLTPFLMFLVVIGLSFGMLRIAGSRTPLLFGIGVFLTLWLMGGGEYIMYDYELYRAAQQGLSAEKLYRFKDEYTFANHLTKMGVFDYAFMLLALVSVWRRLWPFRTDELVILRPSDAG